MNPKNPSSPLTTAIALFTLLTFACLCPHLSADDYPPRPLPDEDRQTLTEYLARRLQTS